VYRTIVLTALLRKLRLRVAIWRRRLEWYRLVGPVRDLPFLAMLGVPMLGVVGIVSFAYLKGPRLDPARVEATQREAQRAQRRESDLQCLAENIYFEARGEPLNGQYAVAEVTLNRTRSQ